MEVVEMKALKVQIDLLCVPLSSPFQLPISTFLSGIMKKDFSQH